MAVDVTITQESGVDWAAVAQIGVLFLTAAALIGSLWKQRVDRRDRVQPVVWIRAGKIGSGGQLEIMADNMGLGPAAAVTIRLWLIPIAKPLNADEQIAKRDTEWDRIKTTEPQLSVGRPMAANVSMRIFSSNRPIDDELENKIDEYALGLYTLEVRDVHGRVVQGVRLKRTWRETMRHPSRPPPRPGALVVIRGDEWPPAVKDL